MKSLYTAILKTSSFNKITLHLYIRFLVLILKKASLNYSILYLKKRKKKITLLKSPHVHKKAREQFQIIKYSISVIFTLSEKSKLLSFLKLNRPKTVKTYLLLKNYKNIL